MQITPFQNMAKEYNYLDYLPKQWARYKTDNLGISHLMSVYPR